MKRLYSIIFALFIIGFCLPKVEAQSLMQTAKKAEQRARELKQQENSRYNSILDSKDLSKYKQYINDYPRGENTPEIRKRAEEIELWNNTKQTNTVPAYEAYLAQTNYHWFDNDASNSIRNIKQAQEKDAWDKVKAINTISAYQNFLSENPQSGYRSEAEKVINRLEGAQEWNQIKDTNSIQDLQNFISKYPHASESTQASNKLHELKGRQFYDMGNLQSAYSEFSKLSRSQVSYANQTVYDNTMEYHDFSLLSSNSSESSLQSFLRKYPYSKYATQVSNMIAVSKARNLSDYATNYDYNQALSYAKDGTTTNTVKSYISANKKKQKQRQNYYKSWERKKNGGTVNLGLDFFDLGYNWNTDRGIVYYNLGLLLRIGNYRDRVQFAFGLKPGLIGYDEVYYEYWSWSDYTYEGTEWTTKFHIPIVAQLKLNLFNTSENSRFFIYGQYQYNAVRAEYVESEMAWSIGLGMAWKHVDWSLYYRKDIERPKSMEYEKQHYVGMSLIYYWQL